MVEAAYARARDLFARERECAMIEGLIASLRQRR
jgi:hypothetical protein